MSDQIIHVRAHRRHFPEKPNSPFMVQVDEYIRRIPVPDIPDLGPLEAYFYQRYLSDPELHALGDYYT